MRLRIFAAVILLACTGAFAQESGIDSPQSDLRNMFNSEGSPVDYVKFYIAPVARIKGDNTNSATGGEIGFSASYSKSDPSLGLFIGYYSVQDRLVSEAKYQLVPVTLRVSYDVPISPGFYFTMAADGGFSINSFKDSNPQVDDVKNCYVLGGQAGFKVAPKDGKLAFTLVGGYQYLNPEVVTAIPGGYASEYHNLGAPFVKLGVEF